MSHFGSPSLPPLAQGLGELVFVVVVLCFGIVIVVLIMRGRHAELARRYTDLSDKSFRNRGEVEKAIAEAQARRDASEDAKVRAALDETIERLRKIAKGWDSPP
jgi:predicted Holliday junction resolvase-like endonuclease